MPNKKNSRNPQEHTHQEKDMIKYIDVCKKIIKNPLESGFPLLKEVNLHTVFEPIYDMNISLRRMNTLVCYCVLAYDPDSSWLDIKRDRYENKVRIIEGLDGRVSEYEKVISGQDEEINDVIFNYLIALTDWRWTTTFTLLDYHSKMIRFVQENVDSEKSTDAFNKDGQKVTLTEDIDLDKLTKVNKQKGELLEQAINARKKADDLLGEIRKDMVVTDTATQNDFGFLFSETAKEKVDIMSWRQFIRQRNEKKNSTSAQG